MQGPMYSVWWHLSDADPRMVSRCELMVRILCRATLLKDDDCRLKGQSRWARTCMRCELGSLEDAAHMIMQCPVGTLNRGLLNRELSEICPTIDPQEFLGVVLGRDIDGWDFDDMRPLREVSAKYVSLMYYDTLRARTGVG